MRRHKCLLECWKSISEQQGAVAEPTKLMNLSLLRVLELSLCPRPAG